MTTISTKFLPGYRGKATTIHARECDATLERVSSGSFNNNGSVVLTAYDAGGCVVEDSVTYTNTPFGPRHEGASVRLPEGGWVLEASRWPGGAYDSVDVSQGLWARIQELTPKLEPLSVMGQWVLACHRQLNPGGRKNERERGPSDPSFWEIGRDECLQKGYLVGHGKGFKVTDLGKQVANEVGDHYRLTGEVNAMAKATKVKVGA